MPSSEIHAVGVKVECGMTSLRSKVSRRDTGFPFYLKALQETTTLRPDIVDEDQAVFVVSRSGSRRISRAKYIVAGRGRGGRGRNRRSEETNKENRTQEKPEEGKAQGEICSLVACFPTAGLSFRSGHGGEHCSTSPGVNTGILVKFLLSFCSLGLVGFARVFLVSILFLGRAVVRYVCPRYLNLFLTLLDCHSFAFD